MALKETHNLLQEMEQLRKELYVSATNRGYLLDSKDVYQASVKLDQVIVKYLKAL